MPMSAFAQTTVCHCSSSHLWNFKRKPLISIIPKQMGKPEQTGYVMSLCLCKVKQKRQESRCSPQSELFRQLRLTSVVGPALLGWDLPHRMGTHQRCFQARICSATTQSGATDSGTESLIPKILWSEQRKKSPKGEEINLFFFILFLPPSWFLKHLGKFGSHFQVWITFSSVNQKDTRLFSNENEFSHGTTWPSEPESEETLSGDSQ